VALGVNILSLVFEEINKLSREVLLRTKDIVQKLGYEAIYADTDSVFIKDRTTVTTNGYAQVIDTLGKETGLPISIEHNFQVPSPLALRSYRSNRST
jgi:hypothetical protein